MSARGLHLLFVCGLALGLAACGFRPLYGRYGANPGAQRIFASIYVPPIQGDRVGYQLRNSLIDLLQARQAPAGTIYRLDVHLHESRQGVAVQSSGSITRYNYTLDAGYKLTDTRTGKTVTTGKQSTLSAYNVMPQTLSTSAYSTLMARQDAQKRAAEDIAYRIRLDLGVFFSQRAQARQ